jgi:hypothetical protein
LSLLLILNHNIIAVSSNLSSLKIKKPDSKKRSIDDLMSELKGGGGVAKVCVCVCVYINFHIRMYIHTCVCRICARALTFENVCQGGANGGALSFLTGFREQWRRFGAQPLYGGTNSRKIKNKSKIK